jgi:hypothetical protein
MLESVRRHTSLLIAVLAVMVLAASQAVAQPGAAKPGQAEAAAGVNADTVDGRHAVGAVGDPTVRAGKLVATNAQGYLPANIILKVAEADKLDGRHAVGAGATLADRAGKLVATQADGYLPANIIRKALDADRLDGLDSAAFARTSQLGAYATKAALGSDAGSVNELDNPVAWNQLKSVPPGLADGVDNAGITEVFLTQIRTSLAIVGPVDSKHSHVATCPDSARVTGGGYYQSAFNLKVTDSRPEGSSAWKVWATKLDSNEATLTVYAICMSAYPTAVVANTSTFTPAKKRGK